MDVLVDAAAVRAVEVTACSSGEIPQPAINSQKMRTGMTANIRIVFALIAPPIIVSRFKKQPQLKSGMGSRFKVGYDALHIIRYLRMHFNRTNNRS